MTFESLLREHNSNRWSFDDGAQTWDIADLLNEATPEQLAQPVTCTEGTDGAWTVRLIDDRGYQSLIIGWIRPAAD